MRWLLDGETFSSRYVLQSDEVLRFTNISVAQQGTYTCEAQNSAGTTFSEATIEVTGMWAVFDVLNSTIYLLSGSPSGTFKNLLS